MPTDQMPTALYVDGERRDPAGDETIPVVNPTTEEELAAVPVATGAEVDEAFGAARRAQDDWRLRPAHERAQLVRDIGAALADNADELAGMLVDEVGKPRRTAEGELVGSQSLAEYMSEWATRIEGDIVPSESRRESIHLQRHPHGVVAAITPWNYPVAVTVRKIAPALATGNTMVVKPSEVTPLSVMRMVEIIDEAVDLPDGVLNLVTGGGEVGSRMVTHEQTDFVTMTGSRETGKIIMEQAAERLTPVSLELGGKAPAIVMADADIDEAVEDILTARITNTGQVCTCAERIYVESSVAEAFTDKYVDAMESVRLGDPRDDAQMGPQVSAAELEKTSTAVDRARAEGATVRTGGERPVGEFPRGYYYEPTVLTDVTQDMDIIQNEVFGPVSPIVEVEDVDQAIEYANDSRYGLSSYLFTDDYQTAMRVAEDLQFGETYINRTLGESWHGHHIGWKESGLGGEDGKYGALKYTQLKSVYHNYE
ncbi:MAG: aldehyde dehydrogenase [Halobacteriaceae archaeon]